MNQDVNHMFPLKNKTKNRTCIHSFYMVPYIRGIEEVSVEYAKSACSKSYILQNKQKLNLNCHVSLGSVFQLDPECIVGQVSGLVSHSNN